MKILVICQYYYPEPFRITDICEELVKRGHEVCVVTGEPNYPEGIIYSGYESHNRMNETINGVNVHRCRIIPRKTGVFYRFLNYYSFVASSIRYVLTRKCHSEDGRTFDVVFVNQLSPVMMSYAGIIYKRLHNVPLVLYCLDLWPESLVAGGIKKGSFVFKVFHSISKSIYKYADKICVTSKSFSEYFEKEFGIKNTMYLPQYAEDIFEDNNEIKKSDSIDLTFAGNIGSIQSVDTILKAANHLKDEPVHFHIVGSGSELENLKTLANELKLSNVTFYGRRPVEEMPSFYNNSDAMLITMKADPGISMTLPGKVQSYMAAGKPIIGAINGETSRIINESLCGYCGSAESVNELVDNIRAFIYDDNIDTFIKNSRQYYVLHFSKSEFISHLENILKTVNDER